MGNRFATILFYPFGPLISISPLRQQNRDKTIFRTRISESLYRHLLRHRPKRERLWGGTDPNAWWGYYLFTLVAECRDRKARNDLERICGLLELAGFTDYSRKAR